MKIELLITIVMIISITSCSKRADKPSVEDSLTGTWEWVSTNGGIANHIHETPASTGENIYLKITTDGNYFRYTNGVLTSNGTYVLLTRKCIHDLTDKTFIDFSSDYDFMIERLDKQNLEVSDEAFDGIGSSYKPK